MEVFGRSIAKPGYYKHGISEMDAARIQAATAGVNANFTQIMLK